MKVPQDVGALVRPQLELLDSIQDVVAQNLKLLTPIADAWQPTDFLPDLRAANWSELLADFRAPAAQLTDEVLVVLVGDMVTEEALPSYAISLNLIARDAEGDNPSPWAKWMRGWISEENRHGDLLNAFLRLTGRVNMRSIEVTIQHLLANGFNPRAYPEPYCGLLYTSFQERATKLSHAHVGRLAQAAGNPHLAKICGRIAHDESRHEQFYTTMMAEVFRRDPDGALLAFRGLLRRIIAMPGRLMFDGHDPNLFDHFATVAQRLGVYTVHDYISIIRHLVSEWKIGALCVNGKAATAQDFLCAQGDRLETLADSVTERVMQQPKVNFSWVNDRKA